MDSMYNFYTETQPIHNSVDMACELIADVASSSRCSDKRILFLPIPPLAVMESDNSLVLQ